MSSAGVDEASRRRPHWRDPRVWIGVLVTLVFLWLALRDVDIAEVRRAIVKADWLVLLVLSIPSYALLLWLRALRWRTTRVDALGLYDSAADGQRSVTPHLDELGASCTVYDQARTVDGHDVADGGDSLPQGPLVGLGRPRPAFAVHLLEELLAGQ